MSFKRKPWISPFTILLVAIVVQLFTGKAYAQPLKDIFNYHKGDLIANKYFLIKGFPDTLMMGAFRIIVEEYDKGGSWDAISKTYQKLNGIGRIQFNCFP